MKYFYTIEDYHGDEPEDRIEFDDKYRSNPESLAEECAEEYHSDIGGDWYEDGSITNVNLFDENGKSIGTWPVTLGYTQTFSAGKQLDPASTPPRALEKE